MNQASLHPHSARAELQALTQQRIMRGLAALVEQGADDVTFDLLSRTCGVAQRTLYRHYENKEALFTAFWPWLNAEIGMPDLPRTPDEVVGHVPALFAAFEHNEPLVRAMLHNVHGRAIRLAQAEARRRKFDEALREVTKRLAAPARRRLLASVTALCSASGWESMKDNWALSGAEAADAAQWAVRALVEEAGRSGRRGAPDHGG